MPIFQYDPNVDRYPQAEQAIGVLQGNRQMGQRDRALDLQEKGLDADIEQSQRRMALFEEEAARKTELFTQAQEAQAGAAKAQQFRMDTMAQQAQGMGDPEIDARFAALEEGGKGMSEAARAAFYADAEPAIYEFVAGRADKRLFDTIGNSLAAGAFSENPEVQQQFAPRWQKLGEQVQAMEVEFLDPKMRAQALAEASREAEQLQRAQAKADEEMTQTKGAVGFIRGKRDAAVPGSPAHDKLVALEQLFLTKQITRQEAQRGAQMIEIGATEQWRRQDGSTEWITPEERFEREMAVMKLQFEEEKEQWKRAMEDRKQTFRERQPVGMNARGLSGSTVKEQAEQLLGVDKTGKAKFPVLNKDGTPKLTESTLGFGGGEPVTETRAPTDAEWADAYQRAGQMLRGGIGVEGIPQNQPQMRAPEPTGPQPILSFDEWRKAQGK